MGKELTIPVGAVVERRRIDNPWADWAWKPVAALADPPPSASWRVLKAEGDVTQFFAGCADLTLHRKLVEAYRINLAGDEPMLWIVLADADAEAETDPDQPYVLHMVTASPYDAQDYLDSGDGIVEAVPMPEAIVARLVAFVKAHPEEEVFKKRKRDRVDVEEHKFGNQPIFLRNDRPVK